MRIQSQQGWRKGLNDNQPTPKYFYEKLDRIHHFDFDPCPANPTFDGLIISWGQRNYVNPPYSQKIKWIKKALDEMNNDKLTVMLLPVDTSTSWFQDLIYPNCKIDWIRGRLKLDNGKHPAYASMLAIFNPIKFKELE